MILGNNIQYLRKANDITQEELAEKLSVSRQTISKWEVSQAYPEIPKLIEMGNLFHCKVDELLKEDMQRKQEVYSEVTVKKLPGFRMGLPLRVTGAAEPFRLAGVCGSLYPAGGL